ncbi:hypothetical protein RDABS01_031986 [Bienertia sinuspersici]
MEDGQANGQKPLNTLERGVKPDYKKDSSTKAYQELTDVQQALHANPRDVRLATVEKEAFNHYKQKQEIYVQFLNQKAKCHWLKEGDSNTKLFYSSIKQRRLQNNFYAIRDMTGDLKDSPGDISEAFQQYYAQLLGTSMQDREKVQRTNNNKTEVYSCGMKEEVINNIIDQSGFKKHSLPFKYLGVPICSYRISSRYNVPKHSFCLWLAVQQRLPTADRLNRWGPKMQATYGLCGIDQESSDHLFFRCSFSREVLEELKSWLSSRNTQQNIKGLSKWINRRSKQAKVERAAWNLVLSASNLSNLAKQECSAAWKT